MPLKKNRFEKINIDLNQDKINLAILSTLVAKKFLQSRPIPKIVTSIQINI